MSGVLDVRSYRQALREFRWDALWDLFVGDRRRLNIATECLDRHAGPAIALRIKFADGHREEHTFGELAEWSSRFANWLVSEGVEAGDRVAIMLEPSLAFYGALFGVIKRGAIAVPLFTLFGPDGLAPRVEDCRPRILLVPAGTSQWGELPRDVRVVTVDRALARQIEGMSASYVPTTRPDDLAVFQYTSGTTRAMPEAVRHTHRSVVTLMVAALYGVGLQREDRYFCPSSPAWGHGLWHGTVAPLALGIAVGSYSGRFDPRRIVEAVEEFGVTNMAAAPTVYRMMRDAGLAGRRRFQPEKLSYTGEPMDSGTFEFVERTFGIEPCGMYGSTEVGVIIVNYPGFDDYEVRRGALGKAAPGWEVGVTDERGAPRAPRQVGEIAVRRKASWFLVKDRGWMDEDGYFYHAGRSDDVIISAGWTMSAVEIEDTLLKHPMVREAAVIGVSDPVRGQIPKAYIVSEQRGPDVEQEIREYVKARLSRHEYPRSIEFVPELPKTPAGKIDRKGLRERER